MELAKKTWKIQLRYKSGTIVNATVINTPTKDFIIPENGKDCHFEAYLTALRCGDRLEIIKIIYRQVN